MAAIPENIILMWGGTHAAIPTGWSRVTALDGKYPKGWGAENPNTSGGSNTHSHSATAHGHTASSHYHAVPLNTNSSPPAAPDQSGSVMDNHTHISANIAGVSGGALQDQAVTWSSINQEPPYLTVIFVKPTATPVPIKSNMLAYWNTAEIPTNWSNCNGDSGNPDLRNKYLKGASTGADSDLVTGGGATTHSHTVTHGHTANSHTHSDTSGLPSGGYRPSTISGNGTPTNHTHVVTLDAVTDTVGNYTNTTAGSTDTVEPAYRKLAVIKNTSGGDILAAVGMIGLWLGDVTTLPLGWYVCDGTNGTPDLRDKFIKVISTTGEIGNTGGSHTHTHTSVGHSHTSIGTHTHTGSTGGPSATAQTGDGGNQGFGIWNHTHTLTSVSSSSAAYADTDLDSGSATDNQPAYLTAAYVEMLFDSGSQSSLGNILRANEAQNTSALSRISGWKNNAAKAYIPTHQQDNFVKANVLTGSIQKRFDYRVYDTTNTTYITSWSNEVISEPSFRMVINGGPGEMIVRLARQFDSFGEGVDVTLFNNVEVWCFDREAPNGTMIYSGYISGYRPVFEEHVEYLEVTLLHQVAELSELILRDASGNTKIAMNSVDPATMLQNILTYAQADGSNIKYTASSIENTSTTVSYTFQAYTIKEALDKAIELTPERWYWRIDADNTAYLKLSNVNTADHTFLIGKHVSSMETWRRGEDMVNYVYFFGQETAGVPMYRVYSNSASATSYGIHAFKKVDQRVTETATADIMAARILNEKKDPEIRTVITILDSNGTNQFRGYDIESIKPGQTLRIRNLKQAVKTVSLWDQSEWDIDVWDQTLAYSATDNIQVMSVEYSPNFVRLEASSRFPEISKRVEDIYRNAEDNAVWNAPTSPTAG